MYICNNNSKDVSKGFYAFILPCKMFGINLYTQMSFLSPQKLGRSLAEFINSFRSAAQIVTISGKFLN